MLETIPFRLPRAIPLKKPRKIPTCIWKCRSPAGTLVLSGSNKTEDIGRRREPLRFQQVCREVGMRNGRGNGIAILSVYRSVFPAGGARSGRTATMVLHTFT